MSTLRMHKEHGTTGDGTYFEVVESPSSRRDTPPVVLVHGVGLDLSMWRWQIEGLAKSFRVVCYDMWGHGQTPTPEGHYDLGDFAAQFAGVLDYLDLPKAHMVGFSLGGLVGQKVATEYASRLASLVLMNSVYRRAPAQLEGVKARLHTMQTEGPGSTADAALDRWFSLEFRKNQPALMDEIHHRLSSNDPAGYANAYRLFVYGDAEIGPTFAELNCPVLAITGDLDVGSIPAMSERIAADVVDGRCVVLEGLAHGAPIEGSEVMNAALLDFLHQAA